jgi:hypothetical protein
LLADYSRPFLTGIVVEFWTADNVHFADVVGGCHGAGTAEGNPNCMLGLAAAAAAAAHSNIAG